MEGVPCPIIAVELKAFDLRATQPRIRALQALHARGQVHFTADQLAEWADLTTATAYNCLQVFKEAGLLTVVNTPASGAQIYDTDMQPGAHFMDADTGEISDAPMPTVTFKPGAIPNGYEVADVQVTIVTRKVAAATS